MKVELETVVRLLAENLQELREATDEQAPEDGIREMLLRLLAEDEKDG